MSKVIDLQKIVNLNLNVLFQGSIPCAIAIACSGGSDSIALVLFIKQWCDYFGHDCKIHVLTVNHQLRETSEYEANAVKNLIENFDVKHHILTWHHQAVTTKIQEHARQARYELMLNFCQQQQIPWLLFGHQLNDQIETVIMRLLKKSQLKGLAGISTHISVKGINIGRPLLNIAKSRLQYFLKIHSIKWIEDPSNQLPVYQRNRIRRSNYSLPLSWIYALQRYRCTEEKWANGFIKDYARCSTLGYWLLDVNAIRHLPPHFLSIVLNHIIMHYSDSTYQPRYKSLMHLCRCILNNSFKTSTLNNLIFRIYKKYLIIFYSHRIINNVLQPYNGSAACYGCCWELNYLTDKKNLFLSQIGIKGWEQCVKIEPKLKNIDIYKPALMAIPWLWYENKLYDAEFFIKSIIMRENINQNVLRLISSYHQSSFCFFKNIDDQDISELNIRITA